MHGGYSNSIVWPQSVFLCIRSFLHNFIDSYYCTCSLIAHSFISRFGYKREHARTHSHTDLCRSHIRFLMRSSSLLLYCFCCHRPSLYAMVFAWNWNWGSAQSTGLNRIRSLSCNQGKIDWMKQINHRHQIKTWTTTFFSWIICEIWETSGGKSELNETESLGSCAYLISFSSLPLA